MKRVYGLQSLQSKKVYTIVRQDGKSFEATFMRLDYQPFRCGVFMMNDERQLILPTELVSEFYKIYQE